MSNQETGKGGRGWNSSPRPEAHTVEASYLTQGLNWRADYVVVVNQNDTKADLNGWVTVNNTSGATYRDAELKLVAGDVNRVRDAVSGGTPSAWRPSPPMRYGWPSTRTHRRSRNDDQAA